MNCSDCEARLAVALDAQPIQNGAVAEHLEGCAPCRRTLEELRAVRRELAETGARLPSDPSFLARLRLRAEQLGLLGEIERMAWWRRWTLRLAPVTALALFFLVGSTLLRGRGVDADALGDLEQGILTAGSPVVLLDDGNDVEPLLAVFDRGHEHRR